MVPISYYGYRSNRVSAGDVFTGALVVIAIVIVAVVFVNWVIDEGKRLDAHKAEWDAGKGRPEVVELKRDPARDVTVELTKTIDAPVEWWDDCSRKSCKRWDIHHYPAVYKVGTLSQAEPNCFVGKPGNAVGSLKIASTRGGAYTATYAADGKQLKICAIGPRQDNDKVVIWSDDPAAKR